MATVQLDRQECDREETLPAVCMKCGNPADADVPYRFDWCPPWVSIFVLINIVVWFILSLVLTRRMTVYVPLCPEHVGLFRRRTLYSSLFFVLSFVSPVGGFGIAHVIEDLLGIRQMAPLPNLLVLSGIVGFFICILIALRIKRSGINASRITEDEITLTGVHDFFAEAVRDARKTEEYDTDRHGRSDSE